MNVQIQIKVKPGSHAQAGTAQRLIEQVAVEVGAGETGGTHTHRSADGQTVFGEATYTVEPDAKSK